MAKKFERKYSFEVPKLRDGENTETYEIDSSFFHEFESPTLSEGKVDVVAKIVKYHRHLDVNFQFNGNIVLNCDRCLEPFDHAVDFEQRVVYAYDEDLEIETDEVVLIDENNPYLYVGKELYDFVALQVPLRKVPSEDIHVCPESVLQMLGLIETEGVEEVEPEEEEIDPRWAALKKLKDQE